MRQLCRVLLMCFVVSWPLFYAHYIVVLPLQVPEKQHDSCEEMQCDAGSSASATEAGSASSDQLSQSDEQPESSIIPYLALLAKFAVSQ